MNKKGSLSDIENESEFIRTLFNFTKPQEKNSASRINLILTFIQNSKNGPNYFIKLIDRHSLCRPQHPDFSKLFVKCIFSCFPETEENKTFIKKQTEALKFIIFPDKFQQKTNKTILLSLIQRDDDTSLESFLKSHPEIDLQKHQIFEKGDPYYPSFYWFKVSNLRKPFGYSSSSCSISLIDFCCLFGSLKCFKYLLLNKCEIKRNT